MLFLDGDGSDPSECIPALIAPITAGEAVFVSGSRIRGKRDPGSLSAPQIAAGLVGGLLLRTVYGARLARHQERQGRYQVWNRVCLGPEQVTGRVYRLGPQRKSNDKRPLC